MGSGSVYTIVTLRVFFVVRVCCFGGFRDYIWSLSRVFVFVPCCCEIFITAEIFIRGGEGVNHVKRDWLEIFNVNCDLYIFFCVKRDWGYLRET